MVGKNRERPPNQILIDRITYLSELLEDDTLTETEVSNIAAMKEANIEKFIREYHRYSICTRKNGLKQTKLPDGTTITAKNSASLNIKLYEYYMTQIQMSPKATLASLFEDWMEEKARFRSSETISRNRTDWVKYLKDTEIVNTPIPEIRPYDILRFYRELVGNEKMTQKCFVNVKSLVNEIFDYAISRDIVKNNASRVAATKNLNFAPPNTQKNDYFTRAERDKMMAYAMQFPKDIYALICILQFSLGCRIGELKALTWDDYDEEEQTIFIHRQAVYRNDGDKNTQVILNHTKAKKKEGNRVLPLSPNAIWALQNIRALHLSDELICTNHLGRILNTNHYNEHLKKYCRAVGINEHTSHDTRRYVISATLEAGIPDSIVQQNSGHLNLTTTMGYKRDVAYKQYRDEFIRAVQ